MFKQLKLMAGLAITATLVACGGGGGGDAPTSPAATTIDLSPLVGTDNNVSGIFDNSCTGSGTEVAVWQASTSGDTLRLVIADKFSADALDFTLQYSSGNNDIGYIFSGTVRNIATGAIASVDSTLLKNISITNSLNITGYINATDRGCAVRILLS